jgi:DNA-binding NarL/FixJ family response regulator
VLLDRLRDIRPETRMLCLSGYFDVRAIRPTASATSAVLLRKPVEADVLLQAVGELIEASRP